jgi:hypothetical protein
MNATLGLHPIEDTLHNPEVKAYDHIALLSHGLTPQYLLKTEVPGISWNLSLQLLIP